MKRISADYQYTATMQNCHELSTLPKDICLCKSICVYPCPAQYDLAPEL